MNNKFHSMDLICDILHTTKGTNAFFVFMSPSTVAKNWTILNLLKTSTTRQTFTEEEEKKVNSY